MRSATYTSATPARSARGARGVALGLAAAASLLLAGGCSSSTTGSGVPTTGGQGSGSSSPASTGTSGGSGGLHGAPDVAHPLDTTKYQAAPCTVLTSAQLQQLGLGAGAPPTAGKEIGPSCDWKTLPNRYVGLQFALHPVDQQGNPVAPGLKGLYGSESSLLKRMPDVDGYPMVGPKTPLGDGSCDQFVGVSNDLALHVTATLYSGDPSYNDPCGYGQTLAKAALDTMTSGG